MIQVSCPGCGASFELKDSDAGRRAKCHQCNRVFVIGRPLAGGTNDAVDRELARAREHLLDLTLRNRLLNFRPTKRTTIHVVDELPDQIWKLLVVFRKRRTTP